MVTERCSRLDCPIRGRRSTEESRAPHHFTHRIRWHCFCPNYLRPVRGDPSFSFKGIAVYLDRIKIIKKELSMPEQTPQPDPASIPKVAEGEYLTTNQGVRISDNQNSLKAGSRGPTLLEDFILR